MPQHSVLSFKQRARCRKSSLSFSKMPLTLHPKFFKWGFKLVLKIPSDQGVPRGAALLAQMLMRPFAQPTVWPNSIQTVCPKLRLNPSAWRLVASASQRKLKYKVSHQLAHLDCHCLCNQIIASFINYRQYQVPRQINYLRHWRHWRQLLWHKAWTQAGLLSIVHDEKDWHCKIDFEHFNKPFLGAKNSFWRILLNAIAGVIPKSF